MDRQTDGGDRERVRRLASGLLKLTAAVCSVWGVTIVLRMSGNEFMGNGRALMYFTVQSNIFLAAVELAVLASLLLGKDRPLPAALGALHFWAVVSVTLTLTVFCVMLAPFIPGAWVLPNLLTHVFAPSTAVLDYLLLDRNWFPEKRQVFLATIPPFAYLGYTIVAYLAGWEFAPGVRYPYLFLNHGGSAGVFGFSTDLSDSLFLGSFYWVVILVAFVVGVAALYRRVHNGGNTRGSSESSGL